MVDNGALGLLSASVETRISALVANAGAIARTVGVDDALRSAASVRISLVFGQTGAGTALASRVWTTGRRVARILWSWL